MMVGMGNGPVDVQLLVVPADPTGQAPAERLCAAVTGAATSSRLEMA
jgi:hypothetical protein